MSTNSLCGTQEFWRKAKPGFKQRLRLLLGIQAEEHTCFIASHRERSSSTVVKKYCTTSALKTIANDINLTKR